MTRTERSFNPRAVIRDRSVSQTVAVVPCLNNAVDVCRSESKSGLDKSDRKGGAGAHNWGSYADEESHEYGAVEDYYDEDASLNEDGACF